jgi:hypothetical protein
MESNRRRDQQRLWTAAQHRTSWCTPIAFRHMLGAGTDNFWKKPARRGAAMPYGLSA